jgi:hypothetical protein
MTGGHIDWQQHPVRRNEFLVFSTQTDITGAACNTMQCNARLSVSLNLFPFAAGQRLLFAYLLGNFSVTAVERVSRTGAIICPSAIPTVNCE